MHEIYFKHLIEQGLAMNRMTESLVELLTRHADEFDSITPPVIMAEYVIECMRSFDKAMVFMGKSNQKPHPMDGQRQPQYP